MAKFKDKYGASVKPTLIRKKKGEGFKRRHRRRRAVALSNETIASEWAEENEMRFRIANNGHHWMFTASDDPPEMHFAQWWPQTAKLVLWHKWDHAIHAHDIAQVIAEMKLVLNRKGRKVHGKPKDWSRRVTGQE
jgi:hypothetical protein